MSEVGRPTLYNIEVAGKICELTATTSRSLKSICSELGLGVSTVLQWLADPTKKEFTDMYARAKEEQADYLAEEILEIADDSSNDLDRIDDFGNRIENKEFVNRSKLRVDARKWVASKLKPRKYGDKVDITSGDKPISNELTIKGQKFADNADKP